MEEVKKVVSETVKNATKNGALAHKDYIVAMVKAKTGGQPSDAEILLALDLLVKEGKLRAIPLVRDYKGGPNVKVEFVYGVRE